MPELAPVTMATRSCNCFTPASSLVIWHIIEGCRTELEVAGLWRYASSVISLGHQTPEIAGMPPPPLLALRGASVTFGGRPTFTKVSAALGPGDRVCLVGRNG